MNIQPVVGRLELDGMLQLLGTGYCRFDSFTYAGLAKTAGREIDFLAIDAKQPSCGNLKPFIDQLKQSYDRVSFWVVCNPVLESALTRYGFQPDSFMDTDALVDGLTWKR